MVALAHWVFPVFLERIADVLAPHLGAVFRRLAALRQMSPKF